MEQKTEMKAFPNKEAWERILAWYRSHLPASEMVYFNAIPGPATPKQISACEKKLGLTLPDPLRESLLLFNGHTGFCTFEFGSFMSTTEIATAALMWRRVSRQFPLDPSMIRCDPAIRRIKWDHGWIPISDNGSSDHCCIDLNPADSGVSGQVFRLSHEQGPQKILANSFDEFLTSFALDLEAGKYKWSVDNCQIVTV